MSFWHYLIIAFLMNGLLNVGLKLVDKFDLAGATPFVCVGMYGTALAGGAVHVILGKTKPKRKDLLIGLTAGLSSIIGIVGAIHAVDLLPGYIAFPLCSSGGILLVALSGRFIFKEKIGPCGILGIGLGVVAIALLAG